MSRIKLDEINRMNIEDVDCYESCYEITALISNAINPVFEIYANNAQMALEILVEKLDHFGNGVVDLIAIDINDFDAIEEGYYNVNGYWIDLDYIDIKEIY